MSISHRSFLFFLVAPVTCACGLPFAVVAKAHLLSVGKMWSTSVPTAVESTGLRAPSGWTSDIRALDLGLGVRISQQFVVVAEVTVADCFSSYYGLFPTNVTLVGLTLARCVRFGPVPRALALTASVRGVAMGLGGADLLDLCAGANMTLWAINPELEVGVRREWKDGFRDPRLPSRHDCIFALVRVGLGGWYEFGDNSGDIIREY